MSIKLRASCLMIHDAPRMADPFPDVVASAQAKIMTAETAIWAPHDALQLHGARGHGRDLPIERTARGARMFSIGGGAVEVLRTMVATGIPGRKPPPTRDGCSRQER